MGDLHHSPRFLLAEFMFLTRVFLLYFSRSTGVIWKNRVLVHIVFISLR